MGQIPRAEEKAEQSGLGGGFGRGFWWRMGTRRKAWDGSGLG